MDILQVLFIILVPITAILTGILLILCFFKIKKQKRDKIVSNLKDAIKEERLKKLESNLKRAAVITKNDNKHQATLDELNDKHSKIDEVIQRAIDKHEQFFGSKPLKSKDFKNLQATINKLIEKINYLEADFNNLSLKFTQQDDLMRSEMAFFVPKLRQVIKEYQQNKKLLIKIEPIIVKKIELINSIEKEFEDNLSKSHVEKTFKNIQEYSQQLLKLAQIVNEGPILSTIISKIAIVKFKRLNDNYNTHKEILKKTYIELELDEKIFSIENHYNQAKKEFSRANIAKSKEEIAKMLIEIEWIETNIRNEVRANQLLQKLNDAIISQVKLVFKNYQLLNKKWEVINKNFEVEHQIKIEHKKLLSLLNTIDNDVLQFQKNLDFKSFSNVEKVKLAKNICSELSNVTNFINRIEIEINNVKESNKIYSNKLNKLNLTISQLEMTIRKQGIIIDENEKLKLDTLMSNIKKYQSRNDLNILSNKEKNEISLLSEELAECLKNIGSKIFVSQITTNLIEKLAQKRALNPKLHAILNGVENKFVEGNYEDGLNEIINYLEGEQ